MRSIFEIAKVTYQELLREKFVLVSFLVAILLILMSIALGGLSHDERERVLVHFGYLSIELTLVFLAVLLGSTALPREIEKQTCLIVLVRPLSRRQFIIGKWAGLSLLLFTAWLILVGLLFALVFFAPPLHTFLIGGLGIFLEAACILSLSLLCSFLFRPAVATFLGFSVFLLGNGLDQLQFLAGRSQDAQFQLMAKVIGYTFPHLYRVNWRSHHFVLAGEIPANFLTNVGHVLVWTILYLAISSIFFRRKDLV